MGSVQDSPLASHYLRASAFSMDIGIIIDSLLNLTQQMIATSDCLSTMGQRLAANPLVIFVVRRKLTAAEVKQAVFDFIDSVFCENDGYFATSCASTCCAFSGIHIASFNLQSARDETAKDCLTSMKH